MTFNHMAFQIDVQHRAVQTLLYTYFPPLVAMVPQMRSSCIFMTTARVPEIARQMLPRTCPPMQLLIRAMTNITINNELE